MEYVRMQENVSFTRRPSHILWTVSKRVWNSRWTADVALLLVALIWGTTYVASKDVVTSVPVFEFLFIRFALCVVLMLPLTWPALKGADRLTWWNGIVFGVLLLCIFTLETYGVKGTTAANAGFIISLFAVMVPVIEAIVGRKRPSSQLLGAVLLSVVGTGLLTLHGFHINWGDLLVLCAAFFRAVQMTVTKRMTQGKPMDSGALTTIQLAVVTVGAGLMCIVQHPVVSGLSLSFWTITGYLAIFATMFAFVVQLTMIRRTSASRVALLLSSEPIFAAIFAVALLGERLSWLGILGGFLILAGMLWGRRLA